MTLPKEYKTIKSLADCRQNILMVGPSGCGKTWLAERLAADLDMDFAAVSCSSGMSESQVAGWLLPTGEGGRFEYAPSDFVRIYENGGVFLFDEIDSADPNTLTFINAALANGTMHIPQRLGNSTVKRHADCIILAAANTYGNGADMVYVGRNQLDGATLDRFRSGIVAMDYDADVEESLVHPSVLTWGRAIRAKIRELGLRRILSTRVMRDFSIMVDKAEWTKADCERAYFADWPEDERVRLEDLPWPDAKPKAKPKSRPKPKPEAKPKADEKPSKTDPKPEQAKQKVALAVHHNVEKHGIELYFKDKPDQDVLDLLKCNKWRWAFRRKCWYKVYSAEASAFAADLAKRFGQDPGEVEREAEAKPEPEPQAEDPKPTEDAKVGGLAWNQVKPAYAVQKRFAG
ncbi:MAG: AAA family ATPase [Planctomycetota bacterium]